MVPFCSLVPPDEKEAKRTVSFDPTGIKIELLMRVERSGLPASTSVWCGSGGLGGLQRPGQEVSWNFLLTCCTSLFAIISASAVTTKCFTLRIHPTFCAEGSRTKDVLFS